MLEKENVFMYNRFSESKRFDRLKKGGKNL